jgi:hypothetical protein
VPEEEKPTGLSWRGSSVNLTISNECKGIALISGKCNVLKGRNHKGFLEKISFGKRMSMELRAKKPIFGRTSCCLIYEIARHEKEYLPILWGYRMFIAISVLITPSDINERKATAVVFFVKDRRFTGKMSEVKQLNNDLLRHFMDAKNQIYHWYIGGQKMELVAEFSRNTHAQLRITLKQSRKPIPLDPMFYASNRLA